MARDADVHRAVHEMVEERDDADGGAKRPDAVQQVARVEQQREVDEAVAARRARGRRGGGRRAQQDGQDDALQVEAGQDDERAPPVVDVEQPARHRRQDDGAEAEAGHRDAGRERAVAVEVLLDAHGAAEVGHAQPTACNTAQR